MFRRIAGLEALSLTLKEMPCLTALDLCRNSFEGDLAGLPSALTCLRNLRHLNLQSSSIGDCGCVALCSVLRGQGLPRLTTLNLGFNNMSAVAFECLAHALVGEERAIQ